MGKPDIESISGAREYETRLHLPPTRALGQLTDFTWRTFVLAKQTALEAGITDEPRLKAAMSFLDASDLGQTALTNLLAKEFGIKADKISQGKPLRVFLSHVNPPTNRAVMFSYQTTEMKNDERYASTQFEVVADARLGRVNVRTLQGASLTGRADLVGVDGVLQALRQDANTVRQSSLKYYRSLGDK